MLLAANGTPILLNWLIGKRFAYPVDNGIKLADGYRLFGDSKTWRGVFGALCVSIGLAMSFNLAFLTGLWFGILTMAGDLLASFGKRRLGYVESSQVRGFDTVPESLLPILVLKTPLALEAIDIILIVGIFSCLKNSCRPSFIAGISAKNPISPPLGLL